LSKSYKIYTINCALCNNYVLTYHKYGQGKAILRLYIKNIVDPLHLLKKIENDTDKKLQCATCENILGVKDFQKGKMVYRMRKGYFHRKLNKQ